MFKPNNDPNPNPNNKVPSLESVLKRQLSATYRDPLGFDTNDDPNSYKGEERKAYEKALIRDLPHTGYAVGLRKKSNGARASCRDALSFFPKKDDDMNGSAPAPLLATNRRVGVK